MFLSNPCCLTLCKWWCGNSSPDLACSCTDFAAIARIGLHFLASRYQLIHPVCCQQSANWGQYFHQCSADWFVKIIWDLHVSSIILNANLLTYILSINFKRVQIVLNFVLFGLRCFYFIFTLSKNYISYRNIQMSPKTKSKYRISLILIFWFLLLVLFETLSNYDFCTLQLSPDHKACMKTQ